MKYVSPYKNLVDISQVICLATNESPYSLPQNIKENLINEINFTNRYPKVNNEALKDLIAARHNVKSENIVIGAGSDEIITFTTLKFVTKGDNTIMADPSFFRYKQLTEFAGGTCKLVKCNNNFYHDLNSMKDNIDSRTKIVFICNPNNPTGTFIPTEKIEAFVKDIPKNVIVALDEAYFDFVYPNTNKSSIELINNYLNVIVFRSFSKFFGLAGLRIGYAVGNKDLIESINSLRSPYNVNSIAQAAAMEVLKHKEFFNTVYYEGLQKDKKYYYDSFKELQLDYIPSQSNFIFVKFGKKCKEWCEKLKDLNIIIRPCAMFGYPEYVRITIGKPSENKKLIDALRQIVRW